MGKATDATYGWLISKYIKSRDVSTKRVAGELGMSEDELEVVLEGDMDLRLYERICKVLGVSADMFVGGAWALEASGVLDGSGIPVQSALSA